MSANHSHEHAHDHTKGASASSLKIALGLTGVILLAELNALCAVMAITKWKKLYGFYADDDREHNSTYTTNTNLLTSDVTR